MIVADAYRRRGVAKVEDLDPTSSRAVAEYLSVLDDAAFAAELTSSRRWRSARAVLIGRPDLWGVACAGEDGVFFWVLEFFRREIDRALALGGWEGLARS